MATIDYLKEGQKVHKLTYIGGIEKRGWRKFIKVQCECGNTKFVEYQNWRSGNSKTCGCEQYPKTNYIKDPLYAVWQNIKYRCHSWKRKGSHLYIGRGISICEEWENNFVAFRDWCLNNGWKLGMQVDKDKKAKEAGVEPKMYSPEWCSILTPAENSRLTTNTRLTPEDIIQIRSMTGSAAKIAKKYGVSREHIRNIRNGKKWKEL